MAATIDYFGLGQTVEYFVNSISRNIFFHHPFRGLQIKQVGFPLVASKVSIVVCALCAAIILTDGNLCKVSSSHTVNEKTTVSY